MHYKIKQQHNYTSKTNPINVTTKYSNIKQIKTRRLCSIIRTSWKYKRYKVHSTTWSFGQWNLIWICRPQNLLTMRRFNKTATSNQPISLKLGVIIGPMGRVDNFWWRSGPGPADLNLQVRRPLTRRLAAGNRLMTHVNWPWSTYDLNPLSATWTRKLHINAWMIGFAAVFWQTLSQSNRVKRFFINLTL